MKYLIDVYSADTPDIKTDNLYEVRKMLKECYERKVEAHAYELQQDKTSILIGESSLKKGKWYYKLYCKDDDLRDDSISIILEK